MSIITDHKPLVATLKKDVATLSQRLQRILLRMHQYRMIIIYKPGPDLFIADWLSRQNHGKNKDEEIPSMQLSINAIQIANNVPECMTIHESQQASSQDHHLQCLKGYIIQGWPEGRDQIPQVFRTYWTFSGDIAVVDGVIMKGRCTVVPDVLQKQVFQKLHINYIANEKLNS